jgi:hypothetical protein
MHVLPLLSLAGIAAIEGYGALDRFEDRRVLFAQAGKRSAETGRPLVVVGDPDGGTHTRMARAYDCGDICLDLNGCPLCPVAYRVDLTKGPITQVPDDSAVVFVSCVLEYVSDYNKAWAEIMRMAGSPDNVFLVEVQHWTATALLYPGAKQVLHPVKVSGAERPVYEAKAVSTASKVGIVAVIGGLLAWGLWPTPKLNGEEDKK